MRYFLVIILSFVVSLTMTAQTYKGKMVNESGKPLRSASVVLLADGGRTTLSFTRTAGAEVLPSARAVRTASVPRAYCFLILDMPAIRSASRTFAKDRQ